MKTLSEFNTLTEAQQYEHKTYRNLNGNEASQILSVIGALDSIENNQTSTEEVVLVPDMPTTVGALCRAIVRTTQGGNFATDPNTEDGQTNRAASQALVTVGVLTSSQDTAFYAKAETKSTPYAGKTEHDFQVAKGTVAVAPVSLSALGESALVTVNTECPNHSPRLTDSNGTVVGYFRNVSKAGVYVTAIPTQYRGQSLFVDNAYGAI